jgi:hypothetical protein
MALMTVISGATWRQPEDLFGDFGPAEVIGTLLAGDVAFSPTGLAGCLQGFGWTPVPHASDVATPNPWKWERGGQLSFIISEGDETFIEFVFGTIPPGAHEFESVVNSEYEAVVAEVQPLTHTLIASLASGGARLNSTADCPDDAVNFIDQECWAANDFHLSIGIAHSDETVPVLFMARLRRGAN